MNRYQKVIAIVAAANIFVMLLFPPFLDNPMARGMPRSFEGFHFFFMAPSALPIHTELLTIEIFFVMTNALAAWLALNRGPDAASVPTGASVARGMVIFGIINAALIALFPPFEPYPSMMRALPGGGFDGFYFALGDKMRRDLCLPMLYLETILVTANLLAIWLMFGTVRRKLSAAAERLLDIVHRLPSQELEALANTLRQEIESSDDRPPSDRIERLGRHDDRRCHEAADFSGPERRGYADRRKPSA